MVRLCVLFKAMGDVARMGSPGRYQSEVLGTVVAGIDGDG